MNNYEINTFNFFYLPLFIEYKSELVGRIDDGEIEEDEGLTAFIESELSNDDKLSIMERIKSESELDGKLDRDTIEFAIINWIEDKFDTCLS